MHELFRKGNAMSEQYDSTADTWDHILKVQKNIDVVRQQLELRAIGHDKSKLRSPEKEAYDGLTQDMKASTAPYGSEEYRAILRKYKPAIDHHFQVNRHHPEFFGEQGINGMTLIDLVEMLCDWKAASLRGNGTDADLGKNFGKNFDRYGIGEQLATILENTRKELGW
jgi:hypothetical protein